MWRKRLLILGFSLMKLKNPPKTLEMACNLFFGVKTEASEQSKTKKPLGSIYNESFPEFGHTDSGNHRIRKKSYKHIQLVENVMWYSDLFFSFFLNPIGDVGLSKHRAAGSQGFWKTSEYIKCKGRKLNGYNDSQQRYCPQRVVDILLQLVSLR